MIQSNKSDSHMIVIKYSWIITFIKNRFIEILGLLIVIISILLFLSILSYSPDDPNFIVSNEKTEIKNILGFYGSAISSLLLQSFGLIIFLFCISLFSMGFLIIKNKNFNYLLTKILYSMIYLSSGSAFFSIYKNNSYWLKVNGNGGFVGQYLNGLIYDFLDLLNYNIIFFSLLAITLFFFFLSIKFNLKTFLNIVTFIFKFFKKDSKLKEKIEISTSLENFSDNENKIEQQDLPFQKTSTSAKNKKFILPDIDYLEKPQKISSKILNDKNKNSDPEFLEKILLDFGVEGKIKKISHGPVVTLNEFEPAPGIKVSKIINLSEDIARNTSSESTRIATIPGKNTIGIEIPNLERESVSLSEIISDDKFYKKEIKLPIALGKSISGIPIIGDLTSMPHLLIAGTTGSGKSVCINTIIMSLIYKHSPEKCKFILIDPKMLELSTYEGIPHLLCPVITEPKKATSVLGWVVKEMENRYKLMTREGVRNIDGYNSKYKILMPYIVVIVDEMSDLMLVAGKEIENYIQKLSQMARAAGIHIIMATQRPSVDVITGTIKANFPTRISFQVSSKIDSRTILGEQGAEQLLGKGDMLFMSSANRIIRIHGPYVSEKEIEKVNSFLRSQQDPDYVEEIINFTDNKENLENFLDNKNRDELFKTAVDLVKTERKASTSFLQRKLQIGYNRAARIIDMMEEDGIVSKANHVGKREVL